MPKSKFRYGNILQTSTLQFDGHIREYFVENAKRVVAFYILPRGGSISNFIEVYEKGRLKEKRNIYSPRDIFIAYITFYIQYLWILFRYFPKAETIYFINHQPLFFFFNSIVRRLRKLEIIYWVADYWSMKTLFLSIFRWFMYYYHKRTKITFYISDRINREMNGKIVHLSNKKTVMLGIRPPKISQRVIDASINLCFIGVLVESQGIELLLSVVKRNKNVTLKLIGTGEKNLIAKYKKLIAAYQISDRVFFPNKFFYGEKLKSLIADCHIGIALYKVDSNTVTYFADPAKIKQYAEFGLPIIMTNAAEVADHINRFQAGIIVERDVLSVNHAIEKIRKDYRTYLSGLQKFNNYFNYKAYYKKAFSFLAN